MIIYTVQQIDHLVFRSGYTPKQAINFMLETLAKEPGLYFCPFSSHVGKIFDRRAEVIVFLIVRGIKPKI